MPGILAAANFYLFEGLGANSLYGIFDQHALDRASPLGPVMGDVLPVVSTVQLESMNFC